LSIYLSDWRLGFSPDDKVCFAGLAIRHFTLAFGLQLWGPKVTDQSHVDAPEDRLPISLKLSWATGALGVALLMNGISALSLVYMVSVLQMEPWLAGALLAITRLYDAFSDPIAGVMSDRTVSKMGRRRPFLLWGAVISGISFFLCLASPFIGPFEKPLEGQGLLASAYMLGMLILYSTGYSLFNVPYMAMPAEMTDGYHERSSIHGYRVMLASLGGMLAQSGSLLVIGLTGEEKGRAGIGVEDWGTFIWIGAVGGILITLTMMVTFFGTAKARQIDRPVRELPWKAQLGAFARNTPFVQILSVKLLQLIGLSFSSSALIFMAVNILGLNPAKLAYIGMTMVVTVMLFTQPLMMLGKVIGKRGGYIVSSLFTIGVALSWVLERPGTVSDIELIIRGVANGIAFAGNVAFAMSMLTDTMELDAHRTGMRREGMFTALYSFIEKIAAATGPFIVGMALSAAGFNPKTPPTEVTESVRQAVLLGVSWAPAGFMLASVLILAFYKLDKADLNKAKLDGLANETT
jgi:glycoside/pentoside/hexuronide:cation symporter, GPH family